MTWFCCFISRISKKCPWGRVHCTNSKATHCLASPSGVPNAPQHEDMCRTFQGLSDLDQKWGFLTLRKCLSCVAYKAACVFGYILYIRRRITYRHIYDVYINWCQCQCVSWHLGFAANVTPWQAPDSWNTPSARSFLGRRCHRLGFLAFFFPGHRNWIDDDYKVTPLKIKMEPQNRELEDDFPFQTGDFQASMLIFQGVIDLNWTIICDFGPYLVGDIVLNMFL